MKQKDIATIAVVVFISAVISIVLSNLLFSSAHEQLTVEVAPPISSDFTTPDKRFFNKDSIDPTRIITIGNNSNPHPFSASQQ